MRSLVSDRPSSSVTSIVLQVSVQWRHTTGITSHRLWRFAMGALQMIGGDCEYMAIYGLLEAEALHQVEVVHTQVLHWTIYGQWGAVPIRRNTWGTLDLEEHRRIVTLLWLFDPNFKYMIYFQSNGTVYICGEYFLYKWRDFRLNSYILMWLIRGSSDCRTLTLKRNQLRTCINLVTINRLWL